MNITMWMVIAGSSSINNEALLGNNEVLIGNNGVLIGNNGALLRNNRASSV